MSNIELFLMFVFAFFGLLPIPKMIYRNNVGAFLMVAMICSWAGMIVLLIRHFFPQT